MKNLFWAVVVVLGGLFVYNNFLSPSAAEPPDPNWYYDAWGHEEAMAEKAETGKTVVVYFYTDWCPYCQRFQKEVLSSAKGERFLEDFIKIRINPEHGVREEELAEDYESYGYPSFFLIPPDSDRAVRIDNRELFRTARFIRACKKAEGKGVLDKVMDTIGI